MKKSNPKTANTNTRWPAALMAAAILFFVLFSVFFIASAADHDCSGHDCPVCEFIRRCENTIRQIGSGINAAVALSFLTSFIAAVLYINESRAVASTPVLLKTRMNN